MEDKNNARRSEVCERVREKEKESDKICRHKVVYRKGFFYLTL